MLELHHANVTLGLIVRERHLGIRQESQSLVLVALQSQQQVMPRAAARSSAPLAFQSFQRRLAFMECQPLRQDAVIARVQPDKESGVQALVSLSGQISGMARVASEPGHRQRPRLFLDVDKGF